MSSTRLRQRRPHLYQERLRVPVRWWALGTLLVGSFWLALVVAVPEQITWGITAFMLLVVACLLRSYGSARIVVTDEWLHAGRARIPRTFLGVVEALDAPQMRLEAGPRASARAYFLLRPYIRTGVRITIQDPQDPTPYWLLSTRHASALAATLLQPSTEGPPRPVPSSPDRPLPETRESHEHQQAAKGPSES